MNKHGFRGIRKRCSPQHWRNPYYARVCVGPDQFIYSRNVATAEEAAIEYRMMKEKRTLRTVAIDVWRMMGAQSKLAPCVKTDGAVSSKFNSLGGVSETHIGEYAKNTT
jgi:hypothetical protein